MFPNSFLCLLNLGIARYVGRIIRKIRTHRIFGSREKIILW